MESNPAMNFEDHFSTHAADYARYRPSYPNALFEFLARITPSHSLAWDCATGSGQAARGLARYFDRVIATDASAIQLSNAVPDPKIDYRVMSAEEADLPGRGARHGGVL